jgi:hypothetical protein
MSPWPGRLATNIEDFGARFDHLESISGCSRAIESFAAVVEGVWRDIDNTHDHRVTRNIH